MLAVTTSETLTLTETAALKRGPSSIPPCLDLLETPTACSWAPDNTCLYIVSGPTIRRYEPSSNIIRDVYTHPHTISHIVARTATCIILSSRNEIYILEGFQIMQTLTTHKGDVKSLSLNSDNSLLASTSSGAVHVHNLTLGSHTVLRGLADMVTGVSTFDFHLRTRLLVVSGKKLYVYDVMRPSAPTKTVLLNDSTTGDVIPPACSPFSKTLVAVASTGGFLELIDLEKEKALVRTINLKTQLSTAAFSPEGATFYLGTEAGSILVVDLRGLDKPPKIVTLSESGCPVRTINIQGKTKVSTTKTPAPLKKATTESASSRRTASVKSPVRKASTPSSPVSRRAVSSASPPKKTTDPKKILSPARDPHGNSELSPTKPSASLKRAPLGTDAPRRTRTLPSTTAPVSSRKETTSTKVTSQHRPRTLSSASRASNKEPLPSLSNRPSSSASRPQCDDVPSSSTSARRPSSSRASVDHNYNGTPSPSPDIPDMQVEPLTPVALVRKQRKHEINILRLGTPDIDEWIPSSSHDTGEKVKGKTAEFKAGEDAKLTVQEQDRVLSMQISPRRPPRNIPINAAPGLNDPLNPAIGLPASPAGGASAHELLRTIVQDAMFDFQRETQAEMVGLHLDLLRMSRGLKQEIRALMEEYVGDLKDLRDENQRLRVENERLRRNAF